MTHEEIQQAYYENKAAREQASLAVEDTAWLLDISIKEVCVAISIGGNRL